MRIRLRKCNQRRSLIICNSLGQQMMPKAHRGVFNMHRSRKNDRRGEGKVRRSSAHQLSFTHYVVTLVYLKGGRLVSLSLYNLKVRGMEVASCGRAKKLITHRILRRWAAEAEVSTRCKSCCRWTIILLWWLEILYADHRLIVMIRWWRDNGSCSGDKMTMRRWISLRW